MLEVKVSRNLLINSLLAAFCIASSHSVEAAWSTPVAVSSTVSDQPDISVTLSGDAFAVWQGFDGANYVIQSATLSYGGSWSEPVTLSDSGEDAQAPGIAVDVDGNAIAVWSRYDGNNSVIQAAQQPAGSSWSSPADISISGYNADSPQLAMDYSGTSGIAVATWQRYNGSNFIVQATTLPSGGSWTEPVNITPSGQDSLIPDVGVDPNGNAVVTATRFDGSVFTTRSAALLTGQTWSPSYVLSDDALTASISSVAVDGSGNAIVVWSQFDGNNYIVQSSSLPYGGSWSTPVNVSASGQNAYAPFVDVDSAGNAVAGWTRSDGTNYIMQAATLPYGGSWSTPVNLSTDGADVNNLQVKVHPAGDAVAVWDYNDGTNSKVQAAKLPYNGSWGATVDISTTGQYAYLPVVGMDSSGNATALWLESNGTEYVVTSATLPAGS